MSDTTLHLVPQNTQGTTIDKDLQDLFVAHNVIMGSTRTLVLQQPFSNLLLTTLPEDQALAKAHAETFAAGWGFGVAQTALSTVHNVASFLTNLCETGLSASATALDATPSGAAASDSQLADFRDMLDSIVGTCCDLSPDSDSMLGRLQDIRGELQLLSSQADDDFTRLQTAIVEVDKSGTIASLSAKLTDVQSRWAEVNSELAKGATTTIAKDIEFGFEFSSAFIDGVKTGPIIAGALSIAGEVEAVQEFQKETKELSDQQTTMEAEISKLVSTIAVDKTNKISLTLTAAQFSIFNDQLKIILGMTSSVIDQMSGWKHQIDLLAEQARPVTPGYFFAQVSGCKDFWSSLASEIQRYQSILRNSSR